MSPCINIADYMFHISGCGLKIVHPKLRLKHVLFGKQEIHAKLTNFEARRSNDESNLDEDQIKFAKLFFHYGGDNVSRFQMDYVISYTKAKRQFPFAYQQCSFSNAAHVETSLRRISHIVSVTGQTRNVHNNIF